MATPLSPAEHSKAEHTHNIKYHSRICSSPLPRIIFPTSELKAALDTRGWMQAIALLKSRWHFSAFPSPEEGKVIESCFIYHLLCKAVEKSDWDVFQAFSPEHLADEESRKTISSLIAMRVANKAIRLIGKGKISCETFATSTCGKMFNAEIVKIDPEAHEAQGNTIKLALVCSQLYEKYIGALEAGNAVVAASILEKICGYNPEFLTQAATSSGGRRESFSA